MTVQGSFQGDTDRSLWQWHYGSVKLRRLWLARWLSLAVGVSQRGLGQLLGTPGNRSAQPVFAELMWSLDEVLTVTMPVHDLVCHAAVGL